MESNTQEIRAAIVKLLIKSNEVIEPRFIKIAINLALAIYVVLLFWGLYINADSRQQLNEFKYNLHPFKTIYTYVIDYKSNNKEPFIINIIGNIALFIPFGFLLPITFLRQLNRLDKLLFVTVCGIFLIEISQFILQIGVFDIDDIILNSIGVILGFMILKTIE